MTDSPINHLSLEQEALLFGYRDRWSRVPLQGDRTYLNVDDVGDGSTPRRVRSASTDLYDPAKAAEAIKMSYALSGMAEPKIVHFPSPEAGYQYLLEKLQTTMGSLEDSAMGIAVGLKLQQSLLQKLVRQLSEQVGEQLIDKLQVSPYSQLGSLVGAQMGTELGIRQFLGLALGVGASQALEKQMPWVRPLTKMLVQMGFEQTSSFFDLPIEVEAYDGEGNPVTDRMYEVWGMIFGGEQSLQLLNCVEPELWAAYCGYLDFFFSVLRCYHDDRAWYTLKYWVKHCGWVLPFEHLAIACARPSHLLFDSDDRIHGSGEPAVQYSDGFRVYATHGERRSYS